MDFKEEIAMSISVNNNTSNLYNNRVQQMKQRDNFQKLSSGKKINSAKDDAAGLAISEKMLKEINRANKEIENYQDEQSMIKVSDGMYEGTSDYLMDMYEQGVRMNSGLMSDDDKEVINKYMGQLKDDAAAMLNTTKFNETKVADKNAVNSLPQNFDLDSIEESLNSINRERSKDGAEYNGLEHRINNKKAEEYNTTAGRSRITDTEYGGTVSELNKNRTLDTYRNMMQSRLMQDNADSVTRLF